MDNHGTFYSICDKTRSGSCKVALKKLSSFHLNQKHLLVLRANGKQNGRYYYDWGEDLAPVEAPNIKPTI